MSASIAELKLSKFLKSNGSGITEELGTALIEHFGGVTSFLKKYKDFDSSVMEGGRGNSQYDFKNILFYDKNKEELSSLMIEMAECCCMDSAILMIHTGMKEDLMTDVNMDDIGCIYFNLKYRATDSNVLMIIDWVIWSASLQLCLAFDADYESIELDL